MRINRRKESILKYRTVRSEARHRSVMERYVYGFIFTVRLAVKRRRVLFFTL